MKVKFLQGLPGSGKTTFAKKFVEKNADWVRVSRDDLRNMRGKYWLPKQEKMISKFESACIIDALSEEKNVVVDATNFNPKHLTNLKNIIKTEYPGIEFETKFFDVSLEKCIKRDLERPNSVGEKVIRNFYKKYIEEDITIKQDVSLPHAIICDLDGTLCMHNGRTPYEYDKCDTDLINNTIHQLLVGRPDNTIIIFMSGREDSCKQKTIDWLFLQGGFKSDYYELFMRKTDDFRKDFIIKKELFDQHIKDKYYVEFALDDRNQVVEMWRKLGLTCLQVAEGDF